MFWKLIQTQQIKDIPKSVSESLRKNPKNVLNLFWYKSVENQFDSFRFNPRLQYELIRNYVGSYLFQLNFRSE